MTVSNAGVNPAAAGSRQRLDCHASRAIADNKTAGCTLATGRFGVPVIDRDPDRTMTVLS
jgi:hypothetical protein